MKPRAIVTGAAGFIGYHLCRRLLDDGYEVLGVDNLSTGQKRNFDDLAAIPGFQPLCADVLTMPEPTGRFDRLFNLACPASPVDFGPRALDILRVCSEGTRRLLEIARRTGAVFIQGSTSECYGDPEITPQPESYWGRVNPIGHRSPYDEGKRFAEALTMAFHRRTAHPTRIIRIFNTYGPRMRPDDGRVLPNFISQALAGKPLTVYGDGAQTRSFCYVSDLVDGLVRIGDSDITDPVNCGNPDEVSIIQLAREVIELTGSNSEITFRPLPQDDPHRRCPDITRARTLLGWQPRVPRREGLRRTIDWFRQNLARPSAPAVSSPAEDHPS